MADFHQTGVVPTFHRLAARPLQSLEEDLQRFSAHNPIALVLPALYSEFSGPAMPRILEDIAGASYLREVVITLGPADGEQFAEVKRAVAGLHPQTRVIWNDSPRMQRIYARLQDEGLEAGEVGKGRSCWMAYGYVLAGGRSQVIALHDCDILNYSRELLARLVSPVADTRFNFVFSKGYYARVTDRMHGRVTRLLVWPLLDALESLLGSHPFLRYLRSFRYPLAGEFCMQADLARVNRIPSDWGLEVGVLAEVYRNFSVKRICQVDLCDNYEHKHQALSADNPQKGLMRMAIEIAKTLFRTLASEGTILSEAIFRTLEAQFVRSAEDTLACYLADATLNGLEFDMHAEESTVNAFAQGLRTAGESFLADPLGSPRIPNWNRVAAALPNIWMELEEAVELDNCAAEERLVA